MKKVFYYATVLALAMILVPVIVYLGFAVILAAVGVCIYAPYILISVVIGIFYLKLVSKGERFINAQDTNFAGKP